eukprot:g1198.t1
MTSTIGESGTAPMLMASNPQSLFKVIFFVVNSGDLKSPSTHAGHVVGDTSGKQGGGTTQQKQEKGSVHSIGDKKESLPEYEIENDRGNEMYSVRINDFFATNVCKTFGYKKVAYDTDSKNVSEFLHNVKTSSYHGFVCSNFELTESNLIHLNKLVQENNHKDNNACTICYHFIALCQSTLNLHPHANAKPKPYSYGYDLVQCVNGNASNRTIEKPLLMRLVMCGSKALNIWYHRVLSLNSSSTSMSHSGVTNTQSNLSQQIQDTNHLYSLVNFAETQCILVPLTGLTEDTFSGTTFTTPWSDSMYSDPIFQSKTIEARDSIARFVTAHCVQALCRPANHKKIIQSPSHIFATRAARLTLSKTVESLTKAILSYIKEGQVIPYRNACIDDMTCFEPEARGHIVRGPEFHDHYFSMSKTYNASLGGSDEDSKKSAVKDVVGTTQTLSSPHVRLLGGSGGAVLDSIPSGAVITYIRLCQRGVETTAYEETRVFTFDFLKLYVNGCSSGRDKSQIWTQVHFHRSKA